MTTARRGPVGLWDASAAVDVEGHLCVWGKIDNNIFSYTTPTVVQTARVERVGLIHILALDREAHACASKIHVKTDFPGVNFGGVFSVPLASFIHCWSSTWLSYFSV